MKRFFLLTVAFLMAVSLLSGCKVEFPDQAILNNSSINISSAISASEQSSSTSSTFASSSSIQTGSLITSEGSKSLKGSSSASAPKVTSSTVSNAGTKVQTCTISIDCKTILNNMDKLKGNKLTLINDFKDGVILPLTAVEFKEGDTVYDLLVRMTKGRGMQMEYKPGALGNYIQGIANIYEEDCGSGSGWTYLVNGKMADKACDKYVLKDGDVVAWRYTCEVGDILKKGM